MNLALQQKNMLFAQFTPPPPPESMLITLSSTMVILYLVNIVQGGGGMFYLGLGYLKICQKMVKCLISFATDCSLLHNCSTRTKMSGMLIRNFCFDP